MKRSVGYLVGFHVSQSSKKKELKSKLLIRDSSNLNKIENI